ncbi:MAG: hypothetical protein RLN78_07880 [Phycisphaerales bacterium]
MTLKPRLAFVAFDYQLERMTAFLRYLPECEVVAFDLRNNGFERDIIAYGPDAIIQYGTETTDEPRVKLNQRYAIAQAIAPTFYAENAWLPQRDYLYVDAIGLAEQSDFAESSLKSQVDTMDTDALDEALEHYRRVSAGSGSFERGEFVLGCLQIPDDTVIRRASPVQDMQVFINELERHLRHVPLVIRPHPLDPRSYTASTASLRSDGRIGDWIRRARAVVACNSTTLLESVAWGTPAIALGRGVYSGKSVCAELNGDWGLLPSALKFTPDEDEARRFLWDALIRQVPILPGSPDLTEWNPVIPLITELLTCA